MNMKIPKNNERFYWTNHVFRKMQFYGLSETKIKGVLSRPDRKEDGIAVKTLAAMQKTRTKKPSEIWVMYQIVKSRNQPLAASNTWRIVHGQWPVNQQTKIISAWRYPGISPVGGKIPIPLDILEELELENLEFNNESL